MQEAEAWKLFFETGLPQAYLMAKVQQKPHQPPPEQTPPIQQGKTKQSPLC